MSDDAEFLANYLPEKLYTHPGPTGVYATIAGESEEVLGELDVTIRCKIAVSAFWVKVRGDFGTFKITKLVHRHGRWREDGHVKFTHFQVAQINAFLALISNLNLSDATKARVSLENIDIGTLGSLLSSSKGPDLVRKLAQSPDLHQDIYAVAAKRTALKEFKGKIGAGLSEADWQTFFESNTWIFGHGLNYVSLDRVSDTLMAKTSGSEFDRPGKIADALLKTRAEVSQFVFVEIKKDSTDLLRKSAPYRPGCWGVSSELSNAVTQVQKTTHEFARKRFRETTKDDNGNDSGDLIYSIEPRSYLIAGNTSELLGNDDKISCFELFRRNVRSPEIITFDELLYRAQFIVRNLTREAI